MQQSIPGNDAKAQLALPDANCPIPCLTTRWS